MPLAIQHDLRYPALSQDILGDNRREYASDGGAFGIELQKDLAQSQLPFGPKRTEEVVDLPVRKTV